MQRLIWHQQALHEHALASFVFQFLFTLASHALDAMEAHEYLNYELEFDLNNPYEPTDEEFLDMLPSDQQELDVDEVVVDEVEEVVGFGVVERALETLKKYFQQRPNDVLSHIKTIQVLQKEVSSHHLEDSHQTTIDSFFQIV